MKIDVGGMVVFDDDTPLGGVTVTVTDVDGDSETTLTAANGLWTITNLHPGAWIVRFEAAGYEAEEMPLLLGAGGENDVSNIFVGLETVWLDETRLSMTSSPFNLVIHDGDELRDGYNGVVAQYSVSANGSIVLTLSRPVLDADGYLYDTETDDFAFGTFDSAANTLTIAEADINAMTGGLTTDTDPWTWHVIYLWAEGYTPLHGQYESLEAAIYLNGVN